MHNPKYHKDQLTPIVKSNNKEVAQCIAEGLVCHSECDESGCWGPGDEQVSNYGTLVTSEMKK